MPALVMFVIVVENSHFISEKGRRFCSRMSDERFLFRERELECFLKEYSYSLLDLLGF